MRSLKLLILAVLVAAGCREDRPAVETAEQRALAQRAAALARARNSENQPLAVGLELVAAIDRPMPTGVAVSQTGRVFVCFPRWGDPVEFTVAEIKNGKVEAYPDPKVNKLNTKDPNNTLVSVQSVVVDDRDRLWLLDTGSINFQPIIPGGAKLIAVDLASNQIVKTISFQHSSAVLPTTYLNDVRFDSKRGREGMAFISDSSDSGPNGIIVVNLATGENWRRLNDSPSTVVEGHFVPIVEGQPLMARQKKGQPPAYLRIGVDGIALTPDGKTLFYCSLASRHLYKVSTDALADSAKSADDVALAVMDLGDRGFASDGLEMDRRSRLYLTDYEHNAIHRRYPDGRMEILVQDPRMIWPDSLSIANGYVYFTCNQLNRQPRFHEGQDLRRPPYSIFRHPIVLTIGDKAAHASE